MVSSLILLTLGAIASTVSIWKKPQNDTASALAPLDNLECTMMASCSIKLPGLVDYAGQQSILGVDGTRFTHTSSGSSTAHFISDFLRTLASEGISKDFFTCHRFIRNAILKVTGFDISRLLWGAFGLYLLLLNFKQISRFLWPFVKSSFTCSITISAQSSLYREVLQWVNVTHGDKIRALSAVPEDAVPKFRNSRFSIQYEPGIGSSFWIYDNHPCTWRDFPFWNRQWIHLTRETRRGEGDELTSNAESKDKGFIRLMRIGRSNKPLKDFLELCTETANKTRLNMPQDMSEDTGRSSKFDRSADHERSRSAGSDFSRLRRLPARKPSPLPEN